MTATTIRDGACTPNPGYTFRLTRERFAGSLFSSPASTITHRLASEDADLDAVVEHFERFLAGAGFGDIALDWKRRGGDEEDE